MIPKIILTVLLVVNIGLMGIIVDAGWCEVSKGAAVVSIALAVVMGCVVWVWM